MLELSGLFIVVLLVVLLMAFPGLRANLENILVGTYYNGRAGMHYAFVASIVVAVITLVWNAICLVLFITALTWGSTSLMVIALLLALVPLFVLALVIKSVHSVTSVLFERLVEVGSHQFNLVVAPNPQTTGAAFVAAFVGLIPVNMLRLGIVAPWNLLMSLIVAIGIVGRESSDFVKWVARLLALVSLYLLALISVGILQIKFDLEILNATSIGLLLLILMVVLMIGVLLDWTIGTKGMPASGAVMLTIALSCLGLVLVAEIAPVMANGIAVSMENGTNFVGKKLNGFGVWTTSSKFVEYVTVQDMNGKTDVFRKDASDVFHPVAPNDKAFIKRGSKAVAYDTKLMPDKSTPEPMIPLYFPDETDPRMINFKTRTDRYFWVPVRLVVESSGGGIETPKSDNLPSSTAVVTSTDGLAIPNGWKEVASGEIPVNVPLTPVGKYQGKVLILVSGKARIDSTMGDVDPDGLKNQPAASFFSLPGAPLYSAIGQAQGKKMFVGKRTELYLNSLSVIQLGPNDEPGVNGMGYKDNGGSWAYKICEPS